MQVVQILLKEKLFYVILGLVVLISSAMNFNQEYNADLLDAYYVPSDSTIRSDEEESAPKTTLRDSLVDFALTLTGTPYQYAGKGPQVFDCSGFTGYVYAQFKRKLPASSRLQAKYGEEMATENVKKGDLVYFKSPTKGVNRVGHVGLVVSNENGSVHFIHSSTGRGVVIDSLSHRHYKARYMGARRVIEGE